MIKGTPRQPKPKPQPAKGPVPVKNPPKSFKQFRRKM